MRNILIITVLFLTTFGLLAQNEELKIKTTFYVNNKSVKDVKY